MKIKALGKLRTLLVALTVLQVTTLGAESNNVEKVQYGTVLSNTIAFKSPNAVGEAYGYIFEGEELPIVDEVGNYYGLLMPNNDLIFIDKMYLEVPTVKENILGEEVVDYAKQFIGTPYVYGGNSLTTGVDCSGFVQQVYLNYGITLERRTADQYSKNGIFISKEDLQPGDLVFYGYSSNVTHVSIYIGNEQIIHCPAPGQTVSIAPLWQRGDAPLMGYKRILS